MVVWVGVLVVVRVIRDLWLGYIIGDVVGVVGVVGWVL